MARRKKGQIARDGILIWGMKMPIRTEELSKRILLLIRLDAQRLFERIKYRELEYMRTFSAKRTRAHFTEIFKNKYHEAKIEDLKYVSQEVIVGVDDFYHQVDELKWYLNHTEDMPGMAEEYVRHAIKDLEQTYEMLQVFMNAEIELNEESEANQALS